ncbi:MAG: alanine:cation symporter family protein [Succinivibrionaceae bacterium]|nr:alanine:cation symporter family protein [Succinivibrionaceae bacterium]
MLDTLDQLINEVSGFLWTYLVIAFLVAAGLYFTLRTRLVQLLDLPEMLRVLRHGITGHRPKGKEISSFQAFCISTASRVGTGNIAGIAIAITLGGPGAIFWMWLIALIGAATGFIESTLAQIYKVPYREGGYHGGPAYYISNALGQPWVAAVFAVLISITFSLTYNSVQSNTITHAIVGAFGLQDLLGGYENVIVGLTICVFASMVIFGGAHRIARVTEVMVPIMAIIYLLIAAVILVMHLDMVPATLALVFSSAFHPEQAVAGGIGAVILTGVKRGLFSNEAGEGSVPNAAACAVTSHPVKQGLIQAFGVFLDTLIICTASAVIVLLSGQYEVGGELTGINLVQQSLTSQLGSWAGYFMTFTITLFAFSSIIGNYYYGEVNIGYLNKRPEVLAAFRVVVVGMIFFGSYASLSLVWDLADLFMALLTITNLYAIVRLSKYAFRALEDYRAQKRGGVREPRFDPSCLPDQRGIAAWGHEQEYLGNSRD